MSRRTTKRISLAIGLVVACAVVTGSARGDSPEGSSPYWSPNVFVTVTPSDELPETQVVSVSGTGFRPLRDIAVWESSKLWWGKDGSHDRNGTKVSPASYTTTTSDADGNFGPVMVEVARTFDDLSGGTYTCAPSDDCVVQAYQIYAPGPIRTAGHHLSFAE